MKLTQEPCPNCHHITEKENRTCPTCGCTKKPTLDQIWSLSVATIGRTYPTGTVHQWKGSPTQQLKSSQTDLKFQISPFERFFSWDIR